MTSGCALEVIGYVGRILAHGDMFAEVCGWPGTHENAVMQKLT
jgi:hypothetical protein